MNSLARWRRTWRSAAGIVYVRMLNLKKTLAWVTILLSVGPAANAQTLAVRANDFLNTLGANTHLNQGIDSAGQVTAALQYAGLRNIREDATHNSAALSSLCNVHSATGVMVDILPITDSTSQDIANSLTEYETLAACGALLSVEGPNEPNNFNFTYNGKVCSLQNGFGPCAQYQADLYRAVKNDPKLSGIRVWSLTEPGAEPDDQGLQYLTVPPGAGALQPDGTIFADAANLHNYVHGNGQTALQDNQAWLAESNGASKGPWDGLDGEFLNETWDGHFPALPVAAGPSMPRVTTETNWPTDGSISEDQQGKLLINVYLSAVKLNWSYTFVYEMFDEPAHGDAGYGVFRANSSSTSAIVPKAAATYIHNMTSILQDGSTNFSPGSLNYSVANEPATVHDLLLQKSNSNYELMIWGDQIAGESAQVVVNLGATFSTINIYDVTSGDAPIQTLSNASSVILELSDHALVVELVGGAQQSATPTATSTPAPIISPTPAPTPTPTAFQSGIYLIGSSYVIDGGFYQPYWGYPPAAEVYSKNQPNAWQQFGFLSSSNGFSICNIASGACLSDGGAVVDIGQATDIWQIAPLGSGWSIKDTRSNRYMGAIPTSLRANVPMSPSAIAVPLTTISFALSSPSATPTSTLTPTPTATATPSVTALAPGTYVIGATSGENRSAYVIDSGFYQPYWGYPPAAEVYSANGPNTWQQFSFTVTQNGFTVCNVASNACLSDGGAFVDIGQATDTWIAAGSGNGWALRNTRTGKYMGAIPSAARGQIQMSSTPASVLLGSP